MIQLSMMKINLIRLLSDNLIDNDDCSWSDTDTDLSDSFLLDLNFILELHPIKSNRIESISAILILHPSLVK